MLWISCPYPGLLIIFLKKLTKPDVCLAIGFDESPSLSSEKIWQLSKAASYYEWERKFSYPQVGTIMGDFAL